MKNLKNLVLAAIIIAIAPKVFAQSPGSPEEIKWYTIAQAEELQAKKPKKILIDIYTDWCGWCKKLDATTYKDPKVVAYINKNFYPVKYNAEGKEAITYQGKTYNASTSSRGTHGLTPTFMGSSSGYPTTSFLDEKLNVVSVVPGYMAGDMMLNVLKYIAENHYEDTDWNTFLSNVNSGN